MLGVILLPKFALQTVLRHQPEIRLGGAVALLGDDAGAKTVVLQCNAAALTAGVQIGMTSSQSLGRCAQLRLLTRSLNQEAAAAKALLGSAFSCSPWVD